MNQKIFNSEETERIIEMAWENHTPFEAIAFQFNITEKEVITLIRRQLKSSSFRLWRTRVQGRTTKHQKLRTFNTGTIKCSRQKQITNNTISKR